jgi:hypothetical protein
LTGNQPTNATRAEKRKAAADAIKAANTPAEAAAVLLPEDTPKPKRNKVRVMQVPRNKKTEDPPIPAEEPIVLTPKETPKSKKAKLHIVKVQKTNKTADPADEVVNTASKRGGGPDGKPGKKARKTKEEKAKTPTATKPAEQVIIQEEEQPMKAGKKAKKMDEDAEKANDQIIPEYKLSGKSILIKPPSQAKIPDQIASIKEAIKGKQLNAKQLEEFNKLVNLEDPFNYEQKDTMKTLYTKAVYDRATKQKGGGRGQALY